MKSLKLLFSISAIFMCLVLAFSCGGDNETSPASQVQITINGTTEDLQVHLAEYSWVGQYFYAVLRKGNTQYGLMLYTPSPDALSTGVFSSFCNWNMESATSADYYLTDDSESSINITAITPGSQSYTISGNASNVVLSPMFGSSDLTIEEFTFTISFSIPDNSTYDVMAFTAGGINYKYYGDQGSLYHDPYYFPNPDPDDVTLTLTANILDDPCQFGLFSQGVLLRNVDPTYPPISETITGYSNGIRLSMAIPENYSCPLQNLIGYSDGDNEQPNWEKTVFSITTVKAISNGYELVGTFYGPVTNGDDSDDVLTITNGTFKITVPSL